VIGFTKLHQNPRFPLTKQAIAHPILVAQEEEFHEKELNGLLIC